VDVSEEFAGQQNHFFVGSKVPEFDPGTASGKILWRGISLKQRVSYHQLTLQFEDYKVWEDTPPEEYEDEQALPFSLSFVNPRTLRLRLAARPELHPDDPSLMLDGDPPSDASSWETSAAGSSTVYEGQFGSVTVVEDPARFEFRDATGRLLTRTHNLADAKGVVNSMPTPLSFVRNASNLHRHLAAGFALSPNEKLFGCGESFTRLDKRGQKLVLYAYDAYSAQTPNMYKPVPFFMSSRGYGMFVHTSAPLTLDLGGSYDEANVVYLGDDVLDLFFFFGSPKEEITDGAMAATLRGGLSLGLCGFSFWGHFIGGFSQPSPAGLYLRWLAFGALCSHSRCHGAPPTEPWEYGERFTEVFRCVVELRYRLLPYLYAQATLSSREGHPMLRALFFEYPEDPTSWLIEDQYLLGTDLLVAPLMEDAPGRDVYLPPGTWIDYQDGSVYEGARWYSMRPQELPVVMLVRDGAAIPHAELAQSTGEIDWRSLELKVFAARAEAAEGLVCLPEDGELHPLRLERAVGGFALEGGALRGRVAWRIVTSD
jgi:alpha-glucosidase (family GH31 glycosyl hydrolase)